MGQYLIFIDEVESGIKFTPSVLLSWFQISSFFCFLGMLNRGPSTIYNWAKSISQFFSYVLQFKEFRRMQSTVEGVKAFFKKINNLLDLGSSKKCSKSVQEIILYTFGKWWWCRPTESTRKIAHSEDFFISNIFRNNKHFGCFVIV